MSVTYVTHAAAVDQSGSATSLTVSNPGGLQSGDLVVGIVAAGGYSNATLTLPSGWYWIDNGPNTYSGAAFGVCYGTYGGESGWTFGTGGYVQNITANLLMYRGFDNSVGGTYFEWASSAIGGVNGSSTPAFPSLTTSVTNCLCCYAAFSPGGTNGDGNMALNSYNVLWRYGDANYCCTIFGGNLDEGASTSVPTNYLTNSSYSDTLYTIAIHPAIASPSPSPTPAPTPAPAPSPSPGVSGGVSYVGQSSNTAQTANFSIPLPTGTQAGDVMLAIVAAGGWTPPSGNLVINTPSGWTRLGSEASAGDSYQTGAAFYRVVGSGESAPTWTSNSSNSGIEAWAGVIATYRNVNPGSPINAWAQDTTGSSSESVPIVSTNIAKCQDVWLSYCSGNASITTSISPSNNRGSKSDGSYETVVINDATQVSAGNSPSGTVSSLFTNYTWTVALAPGGGVAVNGGYFLII